MYGTDLQKMAGIVQETMVLLGAWSPGMGADELQAAAAERNLLGKATSSRVRDVVKRGFAKRYLRPNDTPARILKTLYDRRVDPAQLRQLLYLYTTRSQPLLADFVTQVYWRKVRLGIRELSNPEAQRFIEGAFGSPKLPRSWGDSVVTRIARGMTRTLVDFGLLHSRRGQTHDIVPYELSDFTARFLFQEAHTRGVGDTSILSLPEWGWFGLEQADIPAFASRLAASGHDFLFQYSGEIARFSWTYATMEEFLHAHG